MAKLILYHGSDVDVKKPLYGVGKSDNDYGGGFYTTESIDRAIEWAYWNGREEAVCNKYELECDGLQILRLDDFGTLAWIAEIVANRGCTDRSTKTTGDLIVGKYKLDTSKADVIVGWRADDSYTTVVEAFLRNSLTIDEVNRRIKLGNLGEQVFIKSEKAFAALEWKESAVLDPKDKKARQLEDLTQRQKVSSFIEERERAILIDGYVPQGLVVRDVIRKKYVYNKGVESYILDERQTSKDEPR